LIELHAVFSSTVLDEPSISFLSKFLKDRFDVFFFILNILNKLDYALNFTGGLNLPKIVFKLLVAVCLFLIE
jgi:hypothetical protein